MFDLCLGVFSYLLVYRGAKLDQQSLSGSGWRQFDHNVDSLREIQMNKIVIDFSQDIKPEQINKYQEIFHALLRCGGLDGVKNGRTILHFDQEGNFMGIQFDYWPWKKRSK